jgi:hypothetical protein
MEAFQLGELVIDVLYFGGIYIIMRHMTFVKKHLALFQLVEINTNPLVIRVYIYIYILINHGQNLLILNHTVCFTQ